MAWTKINSLPYSQKNICFCNKYQRQRKKQKLLFHTRTHLGAITCKIHYIQHSRRAAPQTTQNYRASGMALQIKLAITMLLIKSNGDPFLSYSLFTQSRLIFFHSPLKVQIIKTIIICSNFQNQKCKHYSSFLRHQLFGYYILCALVDVNLSVL